VYNKTEERNKMEQIKFENEREMREYQNNLGRSVWGIPEMRGEVYTLNLLNLKE